MGRSKRSRDRRTKRGATRRRSTRRRAKRTQRQQGGCVGATCLAPVVTNGLPGLVAGATALGAKKLVSSSSSSSSSYSSSNGKNSKSQAKRSDTFEKVCKVGKKTSRQRLETKMIQKNGETKIYKNGKLQKSLKSLKDYEKMVKKYLKQGFKKC